MAKKDETVKADDAAEAKAPAYDPMKNRPNYKDPETARQHAAWKKQRTRKPGDEPDAATPDHRFCPVCDYVMGPDERGREVCLWEPLHTPAE